MLAHAVRIASRTTLLRILQKDDTAGNLGKNTIFIALQ
ncbi:hypothetical protein NSU_1048 [Novosphingobium pentaromativorans US6-1]|uniref:Uncharacterized protein n=1 Tax=Novosphingobium pentaromativorans US6-1 TaxID=1088721 RepID=G6E9M7_9SPHN|nr:hypothetical protein NSU_1048 [Novosphingobium pentaromativorans US6-1]